MGVQDRKSRREISVSTPGGSQLVHVLSFFALLCFSLRPCLASLDWVGGPISPPPQPRITRAAPTLPLTTLLAVLNTYPPPSPPPPPQAGLAPDSSSLCDMVARATGVGPGSPLSAPHPAPGWGSCRFAHSKDDPSPNPVSIHMHRKEVEVRLVYFVPHYQLW